MSGRYTHYPPFDDDPYAADVASKRAIDNLHRRPDEPIVTLGDRATKYTFGGPEWPWYLGAVGGSLSSGCNFVRDAASRWGGYLEFQGSDDNEPDPEPHPYFIVGFPLGPRWTNWALDLTVREGPDCGLLHMDVATTPRYNTFQGVPTDLRVFDHFDVPQPHYLTIFEDWEWWPTWENGSTSHLDLHRATHVTDVDFTEVGPHLRIVGEDGAMLTRGGYDDEDVEEGAAPLTGVNMNGGGANVWWWFRFWVDGKNEDSSGYYARIHAGRLVRVTDVDGYPA